METGALGRTTPLIEVERLRPWMLSEMGMLASEPDVRAEDMEVRWPIVRAARDWMICAASGRSYGLILAGGRNVAGGQTSRAR